MGLWSDRGDFITARITSRDNQDNVVHMRKKRRLISYYMRRPVVRRVHHQSITSHATAQRS